MSLRTVKVIFGTGAEFAYELSPAQVAAVSMESARRWFDREFVELECEVASPVGKVLAADRILQVARYSRAERFRDDPNWAEHFALNALALLGRDNVAVDLPNDTLAY